MLLIIDNYDSFVFNIIHYMNYSEKKIIVRRNDSQDLNFIEEMNIEAIIISPGPMGPEDAGLTKELIIKYFRTKPILGICLGHQCIADVFNCVIKQANKPFHGKKSNVILGKSVLYEGLDNEINVARYHSLYVSRENFNSEHLKINACLETGTIMGIEHIYYPVYGVQFHPESILTDSGKMILNNFVHNIAKLD